MKPARSVGVAGIQTGRMRKKVVTDRPADRPTDKNTPPHLWALNFTFRQFELNFTFRQLEDAFHRLYYFTRPQGQIL